MLPVRSFAQNVGSVMWVAVAVLLASGAVLLVVLLFLSPGTPKPFLDDHGKPLAGSLSEKTRVNINGVEQGMFIQGRNAGNPVRLELPVDFLHGVHDDTVSYPLARSYYDRLDAPVKGFYSFNSNSNSSGRTRSRPVRA